MVNPLARLFARSRTWRLDPAESAPPPPKIATSSLLDAGAAATSRNHDARPNPRARILFINQYYWPDHASTAQHLADLAQSLARDGHECHVVCGRGGYNPDAPRPPRFEVHEGVVIHRVAATSFGRRSTLARMVDYLSFYACAAAKTLAMRRFDVVATLTTPPIIGLVGTLCKFLKRSKHIYWSMDLHPDASLALGRMSPRSPVVKALRVLSDWVYRRADRVVALGPYMADRLVGKGVRADRMAIVPVWSRRDEISPVPRDANPLRAKLGLGDKFVVMYSGNMGLAHTFDEAVEAMRRLRDRDDVAFLFVGGGPRAGELRAARDRHQLDHLTMLDYFSRDDLYYSLNIADVHLITMRSEMTGIVVPGKLYGALATGRPTIFVGPERCESADAIVEADCGVVVREGDAAGLARAIERLADDGEAARVLGERGRAAFLARYERDICCDRWSEIVADLIGVASAPAAGAKRGSARRPAAAGLSN